MTEQNSFRFRIVFDQLFDLQTDVESRTLPWNVNHIVAVNFFRQFFLIYGRRDGDDRVRVKMIDVLERYERVKRCIDGAGTRVEIEHAVRVHRIHRIFDRRLGTVRRIVLVQRPHRPDLVEIERRKSVTRCCAKIAARAFQPKDLNVLARERIFFLQLGRRIPAAGVGQGEIIAEPVRPINEPVDAVEFFSVFIVPQIFNEFKTRFCCCWITHYLRRTSTR